MRDRKGKIPRWIETKVGNCVWQNPPHLVIKTDGLRRWWKINNFAYKACVMYGSVKSHFEPTLQDLTGEVREKYRTCLMQNFMRNKLIWNCFITLVFPDIFATKKILRAFTLKKFNTRDGATMFNMDQGVTLNNFYSKIFFHRRSQISVKTQL